MFFDSTKAGCRFEKAQLFNTFSARFCKASSLVSPERSIHVEDFYFTTDVVFNLLNRTPDDSSMGIDSNPFFALKECAQQLSPLICTGLPNGKHQLLLRFGTRGQLPM